MLIQVCKLREIRKKNAVVSYRDNRGQIQTQLDSITFGKDSTSLGSFIILIDLNATFSTLYFEFQIHGSILNSRNPLTHS
mmetsp:Transcript_18926/g.38281  ORF Transcript_18926/g.38281 Transcript_18926/m.38281 type:complete len:80 (-) Transcript_18926:699-938(-)